MNNQRKKPDLTSGVPSPTTIDQTIVDQWQAPFLRRVMQVSSVLGLLAMISGVLSVDTFSLAASYIIAYLILLGTTFLPLPYWLRAGMFLFIIYSIGLIELLTYGILGDTNAFFIPFAIMTTLLLSPKAGIWAAAITLMTFIVFGWLMLSGQFIPSYQNAIRAGLADWISEAAIFALFSAILIAAFQLLQAQLFRAQNESLNTLNRLREQQNSLEKRITERTQDLERSNTQIETAARIARDVTTIRDLDTLMGNAVNLISQRYDFYHAGIFLLDEYGEYAVLKAANSEGGREMLEQGHRLKVGETGIVGFVTQNSQARIALDVGQDAVYFDNPYLSETHSEMALPIIANGQILGALDVQSKETQAFSESDIKTLQILADQLAVAIQNARLFEQSEAALEAARRAYADSSREAWQRQIRSEQEMGFIATQNSLQRISSEWNDDLAKTIETGNLETDDYENVVNIPVKIRGQAIGAIRLRKQENSGSWTKDETALALAFTDQLSSALETARLYREAQKRAARESIASDISSRITTSPHIENVLRDTVMELGQAIGNVSVSFQLISESGSGDQNDGPKRNGNGKNAGTSKSEKKAKE